MTPANTRFLFLLYSYPPVPGTAAKRNERISSALSKTAETAVIFTATKPRSFVELPVNTSILSIPVLDYRKWLRRKSPEGALPESSKNNVLAQWFIRLINTFPVNIIAGEGGVIYFINLLIKGRKTIKTNQITHLYSSYRPFTDHYAAWWLKKWFPHLIWIADFRDLIIDPHYNHIFHTKRHHRLFSNLFQHADILTTVSDGLATHLKAYNPNVVTLRNGIAKDFTIPQPQRSPYFTIAYTGSMFLDKRNPEPLFKALKELIQETKMEGDDIRIQYAGKDSLYWKQMAGQYRFESILDDAGIVSDERAKDIQVLACINVLLTISSEQLQGVLTGKMIEYFETGSPILGIVVGRNDPELNSIIRELEAGDCFSDQDEDYQLIKSFIYQEYLLWKKTGMNRKPINTDILKRKYSTEAVMAPLRSLLDKTIDTRRQTSDS